MNDLLTTLGRLSRPPLLISAARHGCGEYLREIHLRRILKTDKLPATGPALIKLMEIEREMNDARVAESGAYRVADHVEVMIAVLAEARVLRGLTRLQ